MCGILGAQWKHARPTAAERAQRAVILTVLAHEMDNRGEQSHGIYVPESDALHRRLGSIKQTPMHLYSEARSLFGHTRFATQGKVVEKNAHPFDMDGVVGCHNGTLQNHAQLNREYARDFRVDSQHIFQHIADGRPLSEIQGYGTVVYAYRAAPNEILMAHCNGGELAIFTTDIGLIWASTQKGVEAALQAGGVVGGKRIATEAGHLYVAKNSELYLRKENFLTFSGTNWKSWRDGWDSSEDDDARYERWLSSSYPRARSIYRDGKWQDDKDWEKERAAASKKAMNRSEIWRVANKYLVSSNDAKRVFAGDFNPFDPGDELYADAAHESGFNEDLYWSVCEVADRDVWPDVSEETDESTPFSDIVTTEKGVFKIREDGRLEMLHDKRSTTETNGDTMPPNATDTVSLPRELRGEEEG